MWLLYLSITITNVVKIDKEREREREVNWGAFCLQEHYYELRLARRQSFVAPTFRTTKFATNDKSLYASLVH